MFFILLYQQIDLQYEKSSDNNNNSGVNSDRHKRTHSPAQMEVADSSSNTGKAF